MVRGGAVRGWSSGRGRAGAGRRRRNPAPDADFRWNAGVRTGRQPLEAQADAFTAAGCERIFSDKFSGAREDRPGLARLLVDVRPGDTVVVVAMDRFGRSLSGVIRTVATLTNQRRGPPAGPAPK